LLAGDFGLGCALNYLQRLHVLLDAQVNLPLLLDCQPISGFGKRFVTEYLRKAKLAQIVHIERKHGPFNIVQQGIRHSVIL